jgi:hypothetical protein
VTDEVYATPAEAVLGADRAIPKRYARVLAVEYSPDGGRALVFLEYNEPPHTEPYLVLCERDGDGWRDGQGSNGSEWLFTHDDPVSGHLGVRILGWDPPRIRWDVPY